MYFKEGDIAFLLDGKDFFVSLFLKSLNIQDGSLHNFQSIVVLGIHLVNEWGLFAHTFRILFVLCTYFHIVKNFWQL